MGTHVPFVTPFWQKKKKKKKKRYRICVESILSIFLIV